MKTDVVVIGGGLAGLSLSILMSRHGAKVILLEKNFYPFHKVCGEYISMESWNFLENLGVPLSQMSLPSIKKLRVTAPNGDFLENTLNPGGFGISRYTLDNLLFQTAIDAGVDVRQGLRAENIEWKNEFFEISAEGQTFIAPLVFGTYGKKSNLDIKLKRDFAGSPLPKSKNYIAVKYHIKTDFPDDTIELHNFEGGYSGISKIDDGKYCLCYLTKSENLRKSGSIAAMEKNILMKNPFLNRHFSNSEFLYSAPLTISQIHFEAKHTIETHVPMCGDASGMIAPLCGNGMSMAMHGAKLLSQYAVGYLNSEIDRNTMEDNYQKAWEQEFGLRLKAGRAIQSLFGNENLTNIMVGTLKHFPFIVNGLVSLTHGKNF